MEINWSPPSAEISAVTSYRIFSCSGKNIVVPPDIISIRFTTDASYVGQTVSVCTEAEQLISQCINATVVTGEKQH